MNNIYIKAQLNNVFVDTPCVLCGERFDPDPRFPNLCPKSGVELHYMV
jgi:hypothetical protein